MIQIGWSKPVKQCILTSQRWCCAICGKELRKPYCFHHVRNRCCKGESTIENGEARHTTCEAWAHQVDKRGNPSISQINEYRRFLRANAHAEYQVPTRHSTGFAGHSRLRDESGGRQLPRVLSQG